MQQRWLYTERQRLWRAKLIHGPLNFSDPQAEHGTSQCRLHGRQRRQMRTAGDQEEGDRLDADANTYGWSIREI